MVKKYVSNGFRTIFEMGVMCLKLLKRYTFQGVFFAVFILLWYMISRAVRVDYILPSPIQVVHYINDEITTQVFIKHVGMTLLRVFIGYTTAFVIALVLSVVATTNKIVNQFINQIVTISKILPTISIILIALIWLGSEQSTYMIAILVIFPLLFEVFYRSITEVDPKLIEVSIIYHFNFRDKLNYLYVPSVLTNVALSFKQTFGLCFKVMVMAEVLGQAKLGIGSRIYYAKTYLEMSGVFSWTIILIIIVLLIDYLILIINKRLMVWR